MKKITYVIDKYLFDEYEDRLVQSIKNNGMDVYFYDDLCGKTFIEEMKHKFTDDDIVIFHGSLQHGKQLTYLPIYPGIFLNIDNYECYNYYGYFGDYLLNSDYLMMGLNDVLRNKNEFKYKFKFKLILDFDDKLFIRPSDGFKSFAGQTISLSNIESDYKTLINSYGGVNPNTLVLISPCQDIEEEYRFIVIDGEVVSGSLYMDNENKGTFKAHYDKVCTNKDATDFAIKMSKIYQPDKAYTIDVCKLSNGEYKLIELNSFNCASMYGNDYDKVVESLNKLVIKEYNELFNYE